MDDTALVKVDREFGFEQDVDGEGGGTVGSLAGELKRMGVVCYFDSEGRYAGCQCNAFAYDGTVAAQEEMERVACALQRYFAYLRSSKLCESV